MSLRGDDRGVVIQVGAVILFGFLILAITMYQVQVVPDQNEEIEFKHNEEVQDQLLDVRSAIMTTAGGGGSRSVPVKLGTNYPSRTIFLNPSPPYGKLRTVGTENDSIAITIANARGTNAETAQYWDGGNRSFSTGALLYQPYYTRYDRAPTTIYENSVLANRFDGVILPQTNQTIVDGSEISLVALNGSVQESSVGAVSVDTKPLSVSQETITVRNHGGPLVLRIPTLFGNETWSELLSGERKNGNVTDYDVKQSANGPNTLVIEMAPGTYTLKLAKVGAGSNAQAPPESAHYVTSTETNASVQTGGVEKLTVEVRDRYNNPVEGELVTIDSPATPTSARTDSDGQVTFTYDAPETPTTDRVAAWIDGNASAEERVVFSVDVQAPSGGGGGGGGAYTVDWIDPSLDNAGTVLSNCTGASCTWDVGKDEDGRLNLTAALNETVGEMTVEFGSDNTSVAFVDPDETQTGSSGEAATDLVANANGTVAVFASSGGDSARIDIDVTNVTGGSATNQPPTADFSYSPSNPDTGETLTFDASASGDPDGSITSYEWDFDDGTTATGVTPSHTYASSGSYTVALTVTDDDGATDTVTRTVTVAANAPPTADFSYTPSNPDTGDTIDFDASASGDSDGSIGSYEWDFGDGTTATGQTASHSYGSSGTYAVTLTVTDDDGATDQTSQTITVSSSDTAPPSIGDFTVTNPSGEDVQVTFDSNESLASVDVAISGAESGALTTGDFTESGTGPYTYTATYAGSTDGTYTATLNTAEDAAGNDGASGQSDSVTVDTTGPTITSMTGPADGTYAQGETLSFEVTYDEAVVVSGSPSIPLDVDGDDERASYVGGNGTKMLTFTYTVAAGDEDTDGIAVSPTSISGGTLEDAAGNAAGRDLTGQVPDLSGVLVDGVAPSVVDATIANAPINESDAGTAQTVTVTFSEAMNASVAPTVEITGLSSSPYTVDNSSNGWVGADTWKGTVTLSDDDEETTATISVADAEDAAGNRQTPDPDTGNTFALDTIAPTITNFQASNPSGKDLTVTFDSSEQLDAINVTVVRQGSGTTVTTLRRGDFTETCSGGTCEYSATTTLARGGFHDVTLQRATDAVGNEGNQLSTTLLIGGMRYNGDAAARDGPDNPSQDAAGGVVFSITNLVGSEVTIDSVTLDPADSNINELDDQYGGGNDDPQEVEIFARPSVNPDSYSDWVTSGSDQEALAIDDAVTVAVGQDGDNTQSGNLPAVQRGNDLTFHLYEFYTGSSDEYTNNDNVNMAGKNVTVTVEYTLRGTTITDTFTITPAAPPNADAGADFSVDEGSTETLDASGSTDPDGTITSYDWTITDNPSGASVSITDADTSDPTATFDASSADVIGDQSVTVTLTATNDDGATDTNVVNVTVNDLDETQLISYVGGTGTTDTYDTGSLEFEMSNNGGSPVTIQNVSVSVQGGPAESIEEFGLGTNPGTVEVYIDSGTDVGYREGTMTLGSVAPLDDNAVVSGNGDATVTIAYFEKNNGDQISVSGRTVTVTLGLSDGRQITITIDDI